jgi:ssDNA-binding Zn-finger/Zn-ribbon topoisomerase 1
MADKLWRCQNEACSECPHGRLIYDFQNPTGVCPKCGADPRTPEGRETVIPRVCMHLVVKDPAGPIVTGKGRLRVACQPGTATLPGRATGAPSAVTCPVCRATEAFAEVDREVTPVEENAVPVGTKLAG